MEPQDESENTLKQLNETWENSYSLKPQPSSDLSPSQRDCLQEEETKEPAPDITPLPLGVVAVASTIIFCEQVSNSQIFPYVAFMIQDFFQLSANQKSQIGYYAGFLMSCFMVGQFLLSFFWGKLSDRIGRKPVIIFGLLGSLTMIVTFGFSTSFHWALLSRFCHGALNGNIVVVKTVLGEVTDVTNKPKAFAIIGTLFPYAPNEHGL